MSTVVAGKPKAVTMNVRERARDWVTPLNLHWAGLGLLALLNLYLMIHMAFAWQQTKSRDADALAREQVALKTAQIQELPLQGLDVKLRAANADADIFYNERLPVSYSEVATEIGALAKKQGIRLTRVQYAPAPVAGDAAGKLTQVQMDAGLTGDYRSLVHFINGLERDRVFFLVSSVSLTGQQTGTVNLRIRIVTYLRGLGSDEEMRRVTFGAPLDGAAGVSGGAQ